MTEKLVTVASSRDPMLAAFWRDLLQGQGFEVFLRNEHFTSSLDPRAWLAGGIEVQVPAPEAEAARAFVRECAERSSAVDEAWVPDADEDGAEEKPAPQWAWDTTFMRHAVTVVLVLFLLFLGAMCVFATP